MVLTQELDLGVEMDDVGKAATEYLEKKDALSDAREAIDEAEQTLINAMKEADRKHITVDGKTLYVDHIEESERIKIRKTLKNQ